MSKRFLRYLLLVAAALILVILITAGQRWFAVAAIQQSLQRDWETQINGGYPNSLPRTLDGAVVWFLNRSFSESKGKENRNEVLHDRFLSLFQGRVRELLIYNPYTFDDHLGDAICRFDELESLSVVEPEQLYPIPAPAIANLLQSAHRLHSLKSLELGTTWVHDAEVAKLAGISRLETLKLNGCPITSKAFPAFLSLPRLKRLEINDTNITADEAQSLAQLVPNVVIIHSTASP